MSTINDNEEEAIAIPWQTSEAQVGGFAYSEGPVKKAARSSALRGFIYIEGRGPKSMSMASLDPSWQTALVTIEGHLENARSIIRQHRRTFHFRDPFGESCTALNGSWIPMVNQRLQGTGYSVDCAPVVALKSSTRIHFIFIRISLTLKAKVSAVPAPPPLKPMMILPAVGVAGVAPSPASSRASLAELQERKLAKKKSLESDFDTTTSSSAQAVGAISVRGPATAGGGRQSSCLELYDRRLARKGLLGETNNTSSNGNDREEVPPRPSQAHGAVAVTPGEADVPRVPPHSPVSSRTSSADLVDRKMAKKTLASDKTLGNSKPSSDGSYTIRQRNSPPTTATTTMVDPLAPHPAVSDEYARQEQSYRNLVQQLEENSKPSKTARDIADLEQDLRRERNRTAVQAIQIEQLGEQLNEQTARNTIQAENMEDLIEQLREERLLNEEQAETISGLERRLKEALEELDVLRCNLSLDNNNDGSDEAPEVIAEAAGEGTREKKNNKSSKKHKKKKVDLEKTKSKRSELEKTKSKRHKKKKEKKSEEEEECTVHHYEKKAPLQDDGIALHEDFEDAKEQAELPPAAKGQQRQPVKEQSAQKENSEESGDTEDLSTSSAPAYPPPYLVPT